MVEDTANFSGQPGESAVPDGYFRNPQGHLVPAHLVKPQILLQDQLVSRLMEQAQSLSRQIAEFKLAIFSDVDAFLAIMAEQYDVKRGGEGGNMTFTSFNGLKKIQVAVAHNMRFGHELQAAKVIIDECIAEWGQNSNEYLRVLVGDAFRVDKEGQVSRGSIFKLRSYNFPDERWAKAMELIADSIIMESSKTYLRFHYRNTPRSKWQQVRLDLANA